MPCPMRKRAYASSQDIRIRAQVILRVEHRMRAGIHVREKVNQRVLLRHRPTGHRPNIEVTVEQNACPKSLRCATVEIMLDIAQPSALGLWQLAFVQDGIEPGVRLTTLSFAIEGIMPNGAQAGGCDIGIALQIVAGIEQ